MESNPGQSENVPSTSSHSAENQMVVDSQNTKQLCNEVQRKSSLQIRSSELKLSRFWTETSCVKVDDLYIIIDNYESNSFDQTLNELYKGGFYKRLHLNCTIWINEESINKLASLETLYFGLGALIRFSMFVGSAMRSISNVKLTNIKELGIFVLPEFADISTLINLERIYVKCSSFERISPLICQLPNLKKFVIDDSLGIEMYDKPKHFLPIWDKERKKLPMAHKVTIYIAGDLYEIRSFFQQINFEFVELQSIQTISWECPFANTHKSHFQS